MFTELQGQLERITYVNEENGYAVARIKVKGRRDLVTIAGNILPAAPGEILRLKGQWVTHPRYGEQFKIHSCEPVIPATVVGMERYLGSGLIKGIGPVMAKRIVSRFGIETLSVLDESTSRLGEVDGIGPKRLEMIQKAWVEQKEIKDVMLFLQGHGVSAAYAAKIFRQYGKSAIRIVRENPYRLAQDIFGIGFLTADKIAGQLGIGRDSLIRAEAGLIYVLQQLAEDGHVYYPYEPLISECTKMLGTDSDDREVHATDRETILNSLANVALDRKVVIEDIGGEEIRENEKAVYLARFHAAESGIAENLKRLCCSQKNMKRFDVDKAVAWAQDELRIRLAGRQVDAIRSSIANKVLVITGGPGTGKTTIIKSIIRIYDRLGQRILLAAPTGRAAKRMSEAAGQEAKTIHRLLEFSPREGGFRRNETNTLDADVVIIDEGSMVDTVLMHHFLKAVPSAATLILVGDVDQLPSVGPGNVLRDIIDSGVIATVTLNDIFRQSEESLIVINAHRVNNGEMPRLAYESDRLQDFYFISVEEPEKILERIVALCRERIPRRFGYDPVRDIQVITAMHRGIIGATNLNRELQSVLNPSADELERGGRVLRKGDKVMQVVNNYEKDVFNGDIGIISGIDREEQEVSVDYDGRAVAYDFRDLDEIVLAYAISVHKSQGSEYPAVVMPIHTQHYMLLQRNLLYTRITRGKNLVVVVGMKKAMAIAIKNNKPQKRYTYLKKRLQDIGIG
jgi:exodeoxyribonuclease V alpha subunit